MEAPLKGNSQNFKAKIWKSTFRPPFGRQMPPFRIVFSPPSHPSSHPALTFDGRKDYRIRQLSETIIDELGFHKFRVVRHVEQE